jgi:hypothetical protein
LPMYKSLHFKARIAGCNALWKCGCCHNVESCCIVNNLWYNAWSFFLHTAFQVSSDQWIERSSHTGTYNSRAVSKMVLPISISMISDRVKGMTDTDFIGGCVSNPLCVCFYTNIFISV